MNNTCTVTVENVAISVRNGTRLSEILRISGINFDMPCGGGGRCGKCRVIAHGALSPVASEEMSCLTPDELFSGVRLACYCTVHGDCSISLPEKIQGRIKTNGRMPDFKHNPIFRMYGAAIDIGTTTLAARLYDTEGILSQSAAPNPQSTYGADVISRIDASLKGNASELADVIRKAVSSLLRTMADEAHIPVESIDAIVITGNTVMLYLLTLRNPDCLSHAPFEADHVFGETISACNLELPCPNASVFLPPCISAFIGADIVTALLASGICNQNNTAMLADIGTNGEIALWHKDTLTCCSTAAGPAFEGMGLSMGMSGSSGAIDHVEIKNNKLIAHTIDDAKPTGICGSGALDAIACLLQTGAMDETGFLVNGNVIIAGNICLTQKDIRQIQLAKSAVNSGIVTMLKENILKSDDIMSFCIAGGFGSYLKIESAATIGLIPAEFAANAAILGNAALTGAAMLLLCREFRAKAEHIQSLAHVLDLSNNADFMNSYIEGMSF